MNEISQYFSQVKPKLEVLYNKSVILDNTISKIEELIAENTKLKNEKDNDEKLLKILAIKYKKSKLENKECTECKNKDNIIEFKNKEYIDIKNKIISKSQENKPCNECIKKDKIVTKLKETLKKEEDAGDTEITTQKIGLCTLNIVSNPSGYTYGNIQEIAKLGGNKYMLSKVLAYIEKNSTSPIQSKSTITSLLDFIKNEIHPLA
jgi:hypothetical protein